MATTNNNPINNENKEPMYHTLSSCEGYMYNPDTDKLERVVNVELTINFIEQTEECKATLVSGKVVNVDEQTALYKNDVEYRRGHANGMFFAENKSDKCSIIAQQLSLFCHKRLTVVVKRDGKPVVYDGAKEVCGIKMFKVFEADGRCGYKKPEALECELPDDYYTDMAEYYKWNELVHVDADGTEHRHYGQCARLIPTPEQQALIDDALRAIKAARDLGVRFFYDNDNDHFFAANFSDKRIDLRCEGDYDDEEVECAYDIASIKKHLPGCNDVWYSGSDDYVVFFKEEQK